MSDPILELELRQVPYGDDLETIRYTIFPNGIVHINGTICEAKGQLSPSQLDYILSPMRTMGLNGARTFGNPQDAGIIADFSIGENGEKKDITLCLGYSGSDGQLRQMFQLKQLAQRIAAAAQCACPQLSGSLIQATAALHTQ